jgi:son of sevenless-like protein
MSANTSQNGDVASEAGGWTYGAGARRDSLASSQPSRPISVNEDFRAPPGRGHGVPHPWVARLSDDGRSWLYYNQATGETRQDPPPAPTHLDGADTPYRAGPGDKLSHNQVWEERVRTSLAPLYATPARPTLAALVEHTRAAIAQVHEAALRGIAADEQLSVARRTHQGLALAMQDDENAIELATRALDDVVTTVRRMVVAFGYVGPVIPARTGDDAETADEGDDTMQRPAWADNMTLVGNLGLIQYMTHLAITGPRKEPSDSSWNQVMRAATKLGEVINSMPTVIFPEEDEFDPNSKQGRRLMAWFGADSLGDFMSGRFGFGKQVQENELAPLDTASANTVQAIQDSLQAAISTATLETGTSLIEITQNLVQAVTNIDIASVIDLDGDPNVAIHEDAHAYADLVSKARHALRELDDMTHQLLGTAAEVFLQWETPGGDAARERLSHAASIVWHALTLLLSVSQQQAALLQHGNVRGFIGGRSHAAMARRAAAAAHARKQSQVSVDSRVSASERNRERERHNREPSVVSSGSHRTEFLEQDTASGSASSKRRSFRLSRTSMTSQTSIVNQNRHSSSTSSLPYQQESEAGSLRANRASILKAAVPNLGFFAGNKAGARVTKSASTKVTVGKSRSTRKAGKVLGEDVERIGNFTTAPTAPPPPVPTPLSPPPTTSPRPWYLATDYPAGEIVFDENQNVKAGTPRALVVRLTTHVDFDMTFLNKFFLTFRTFVQPQELVRLLIDRYNIEEPKDLEPAEHNEWRDKKQKPIRLR